MYKFNVQCIRRKIDSYLHKRTSEKPRPFYNRSTAQTSYGKIRATILIVVDNGVIKAEGIQILTTFFLDGVAVEPASKVRTVEATLVGNKARFTVGVTRRESDIEHIGKCAVLINDIAVGIVHILCCDVATFGHIAHDITDLVIAREVEHAINRDGEKPADTARALFRAGEVIAPEVFDSIRYVVMLDQFENDVPTIVDE